MRLDTRPRPALALEAISAEYATGRPLGPAQVLVGLTRTGPAAVPARGSGQPGAGSGAGGIVARPGLFGRLGGPARVTVVAAPAGSGKTVLLQSWISQAGLSERAAWVPAGRDERSPLNFWLSVVGALRRTAPGSELVQALSAAPDFDGWAVTEQLLADLAPLDEPLWLVVDDAHELGREVLRQLELLIMRAPKELRFVLAARRDVRLGLHRLRLEGELTEIRAGDLRFSLAEAGEMFTAAGVELPEPAVGVLHRRTEGWAAGLRLAALAAAGHPDPARFAAEFSGAERTVAEYLLAEVLDRQPEPVRRLLLRTSILDRVNGELADLLTGANGGERALQDLEQANAFLVAVDADRSWFRYHQLFADLLRLELRRTAPDEVAALQRAAAGWLAGHGFAVEAVRHAQAAGDWGLAARLLADHWPGLHLDGHHTVIHELLSAFPAEASAADGELAAMTAADELARGSVATAEKYLALAERKSAAVPDGRRGKFQVLHGVVRLLLDRERGDLQAVADAARRLLAMAEAAQPGLQEDLRALALISLGYTEFWAGASQDANQHLERGVTLASRIGRLHLEFAALAYQAAAELYRSFTRAGELGRRAVELAERHGWTDEPAFGVACMVLGTLSVWQGRPEEAEPWVLRAERTLNAGSHPAGTVIRDVRGVLELARGQAADALAAFQSAERLARTLPAPRYFVPQTLALLLQALVRLGETERAEQALAGLAEQDRERGEVRIAAAALRLAQDNPHGAIAELAPVLDGTRPLDWTAWRAHAFVLEAAARDALGDQAAAGHALEHALDLAEPDGLALPFTMHPVPRLLARHARHGTAHASLTADILGILAGNTNPRPPAGPRLPAESLSETELRVLRYLPTNLTGPEIAAELYISVNTVKTHLRNVYGKLGTHRRAEAVARARHLGLLAPAPSTGQVRLAG